MVVDASGEAHAYVYFEDEPGRRAAAKLLTHDEARASPPTSPSCRSCCASRETPETTSGFLWPGAGLRRRTTIR
jgi:hypothetical protein